MKIQVLSRALIDLADNRTFIFITYFLGIGAWAVIAKHDFISSNWKSLRETRKNGQIHVILVLIPMFYVGFYIYVLGLRRDFKLGAAVFAVAFASLHLLRTVVALWQLIIFKHWAISAIQSIESLGYKCFSATGLEPNLEGKKISIQQANNIRINYIADEITINNVIIDNKLSSGNAVCKLRFLTQYQKNNIKNQRLYTFKALLCIYYVVGSILRLFLIIFALFFPNIWNLADKNTSPFLEPYFSEEVYIRWASVLIANATPDWFEDIKNLCMKDDEDEEQISEREQRRNEFALELLLSAGMHLRDSGKWNGKLSGFRDTKNDFGCTEQFCSFRHSFLPFEEWKNYPTLRKGLFRREEFLKFACTSGKGLPFHSPHFRAQAKDSHGESYNYLKFASFLASANVNLDAELEEAVKGLGIVEIEWFSVFLSVDNWRGISPDSKKALNERKRKSKQKPYKEPMWNRDRKILDETGFPLFNLSAQLGFKGISKKFLQYFSHPLLRNSIDKTLWENRNVLELSAHIDNWLALRSGDKTSYMMQQIQNSEQKYLLRNIESVRDSASVNERVFETSKQVKTDSTMFQFSLIEPEHHNFEHSMTFMGCSMETLRSALARWVEKNDGNQVSTWNPKIDFEKLNKSFVFRASEDLQCCLKSVESKSGLDEKYFQMRLLWELQSYFHARMSRNTKNMPGPKDTESMILCILSFPSVIIKTERSRDVARNSKRRTSCCLQVEEGNDHLFDAQNYTFHILAGCGPQDVEVHVSFNVTTELYVTVNLCCKEASQIFSWEAWRNSFLGRLEGAGSWQVDWNLPSVPVLKTEESIAAGITHVRTLNANESSGINVWKGWLPHRPKMSQFELETKGFVKRCIIMPQTKEFLKIEEMHIARQIENEEYVAVEYSNADPHSLKRATIFAVEALLARLEYNPRTERKMEHAQQFFKKRTAHMLQDKFLNLAMLKYSSLEFRDTNDLKKALKEISDRGYQEEESVRLLERFYMRSEKLSEFFEDTSKVACVQESFDSLLLKYNFSTKVAVPFARFYTIACSNGRSELYHEARRMLFQSMIENLRSGKKESALECRFALHNLIRTDRKEDLSFSRTALRNTIDPNSSLKDNVNTNRKRSKQREFVSDRSIFKCIKKKYWKTGIDDLDEVANQNFDEIDIERGIADARHTLEIIEETNK